jgi:hypothetical protein
MNEFSILNELRKSSIGFWIAFFLSFAEAGYTFVIVHRTSSLGDPYRTAQALFIAFLLDMAVLYFTIFAPKEREHISKFFLAGMFINIILAQLPWNDYINFVSIGVIAIEVASAIYFFSEMSLIQSTKKRAERTHRPKPVQVSSTPRTSPLNGFNGEMETEIIKLYTNDKTLSYREIARQLSTNHKKVSRTIEKNGFSHGE